MVAVIFLFTSMAFAKTWWIMEDDSRLSQTQPSSKFNFKLLHQV